ncbi:hypothetical protein IAD21_05449 [Abditibacteriota bacterium]|nr:hypothetical protein IAD21_05449 [Abditibacteriota bacterium]
MYLAATIDACTRRSMRVPGARCVYPALDACTRRSMRVPGARCVYPALDACTRRCAGWCIRDHMETSLVKEAAHMAFGPERDAGRLHHWDHGSQYASEEFRSLLEKEGIVQSMSRKGNCYDNALSESFWATVKTECFDNFRNGVPPTQGQVVRSLFHYIELFYNRERLHSALEYKSPVQFENDWTRDHWTENVST